MMDQSPSALPINKATEPTFATRAGPNKINHDKYPLYPLLLPNDHLGTPLASNRVTVPLVSLRPKQQNLKQAPNNSSAQLSHKNPIVPPTATNCAGRGHNRKTPRGHLTSTRNMPTLNNTSKNLHLPRGKMDTDCDDGFQLVVPKTKTNTSHTLTTPDMQVFRILLSRTGPKEDLANYSIKFGQFLQALISFDRDIMILPYTCDVERINKALDLLKSPQDFKSLMDITLTNWGNPSEGKG